MTKGLIKYEKHCDFCGRIFYYGRVGEYPLKRKQRKKTAYFCSLSCLNYSKNNKSIQYR